MENTDYNKRVAKTIYNAGGATYGEISQKIGGNPLILNHTLEALKKEGSVEERPTCGEPHNPYEYYVTEIGVKKFGLAEKS